MRLTDQEFRAMNGPLRRLVQRWVEMPVFRRLGLEAAGRDVLELGCGSGYGAELLAPLRPKTYLGVDIMPEQIELARRRALPAEFRFAVMDAADMAELADGAFDLAVVFDILHHIPAWRGVVAECGRVLRPGGRVFLEEPAGSAVLAWDFFFRWDHPKEAAFSRRELAAQLRACGFHLVRRLGILAFSSEHWQK